MTIVYYKCKVSSIFVLRSAMFTLLRSRIPLYEYMTKFVLPLCSHLPHPTSPWPIASVTTIVDLEDVSLSALWNFRSHLQQASTLATANYPETLSITVIVNSPSFFPTVNELFRVCFLWPFLWYAFNVGLELDKALVWCRNSKQDTRPRQGPRAIIRIDR